MDAINVLLDLHIIVKYVEIKIQHIIAKIVLKIKRNVK
jgi:hypothetical protein